ncbi:MAG: hypothetical protein KVP17_002436 [Porospora cf. gigantea B]|uniref:uncharacterized protein n=1 Tax=Porospora cf. gigantea B TaxID=2853592 RepID=UPI003571AD77|nr:MAG: hypothetical protein KVP17_002436 [Porospora cf. gigantea B]
MLTYLSPALVELTLSFLIPRHPFQRNDYCLTLAALRYSCKQLDQICRDLPCYRYRSLTDIFTGKQDLCKCATVGSSPPSLPHSVERILLNDGCEDFQWLAGLRQVRTVTLMAVGRVDYAHLSLSSLTTLNISVPPEPGGVPVDFGRDELPVGVTSLRIMAFAEVNVVWLPPLLRSLCLFECGLDVEQLPVSLRYLRLACSRGKIRRLKPLPPLLRVLICTNLGVSDLGNLPTELKMIHLRYISRLPPQEWFPAGLRKISIESVAEPSPDYERGLRSRAQLKEFTFSKEPLWF